MDRRWHLVNALENIQRLKDKLEKNKDPEKARWIESDINAWMHIYNEIEKLK